MKFVSLFIIAFLLNLISTPYSESSSLGIKEPNTELNFRDRALRYSDGLLVGGIYEFMPFSGIYVSNLHVLKKIQIENQLFKNYYVYGIQSETSEWHDLAIMVDKKQNPAGIQSPAVFGLLQYVKSLQAQINDPLVNKFLTLRHFQSTKMPPFFNVSKTDLILSLNNKSAVLTEVITSQIKAGSSGALVYVELDNASIIGRDSFPFGVLTCIEKNLPGSIKLDINHAVIRMITFNLLPEDRSRYILLETIPQIEYASDCEPINGKGHGGI